MSQSERTSRIPRLEGASIESKTDETLMENYQHGDPSAFEVLFRRHFGRVSGYLLKRVSDKQLAHDLAQEGFFKLHRSRTQYLHNLPFTPWLFVITRSVWKDFFKKTKKEDPTDSVFFEKIPSAIEVKSQENEKILELLPENQKQAVYLKFYGDETFEEIALKLSTTPANARQMVSRGVRRLKKIILGSNK